MLKDSDAKVVGRLPTETASDQRRARKKTSARVFLDRPPQLQGWSTSDEDEIALRRWRGRTEISAIEALEPKHPVFGTFRVRSENGNAYDVEIRSLDEPINSCGCIDHRVNGLGTCKHIEGVLEHLRRNDLTAWRDASGKGNDRGEVFLDRRQSVRPVVVWPVSRRGTQAAHEWLAPYIARDGSLKTAPGATARLVAAWRTAPASVRRQMRVSVHFGPWLEREMRYRARERAIARFITNVKRGKASFDLVKLPLLPYQCEGLLHLTFGERALLADEMGLGKTVQAIAACELLARRKDVSKVLVVCPASLKAEWEEQIARFTDRPAKSVFGPRPQRLAAYGEPVFFNIVNYEQVLTDSAEINARLAPDVVILDEAQRIKNWHTKTARHVKQLHSPYAFVLTGTPLENRIDELYSIVQFLDPELLGPLFRFNREFYELDERGRPVDYKNLDALRERLSSVMLRRRKADVEGELPGRTVTNYFVAMADEQRVRYDEYAQKAAKLIKLAQSRPLRAEEFERLQKYLACMRMICDTPAILDPECRISPKLEELERVLGDLLEDPTAKVIVFSEWERMLAMVRELAAEMGLETAWHTGSVPQQRRRAEIGRFKQDRTCRLFLSTDSGSVGLNLQVANAVVNVDLPWNPAKLEQRIARAWRKHQTRSITVVNLVAEDSIEHNMVHLLGAKQALADGVLDGQGDLTALQMPSGRGAMIERLQALMQTSGKSAAPRIVPPEEALAEDMQQRYGDRTLLIEARTGDDGKVRLLVVLDVESKMLAAETKRLAPVSKDGTVVDLIDSATWRTLQRLQSSGAIQFRGGSGRVLHQAVTLSEDEAAAAERIQAARAAALRAEADRALRKAQVLAAGGFPEEVPALLAKSIGHVGAVRLALSGELADGIALATTAEVRELVEHKLLPLQAMATLNMVAPASGTPSLSSSDVDRLLAVTAEVIAACSGDVDTVGGGAGDKLGQ